MGGLVQTCPEGGGLSSMGLVYKLSNYIITHLFTGQLQGSFLVALIVFIIMS